MGTSGIVNTVTSLPIILAYPSVASSLLLFWSLFFFGNLNSRNGSFLPILLTTATILVGLLKLLAGVSSNWKMWSSKSVSALFLFWLFLLAGDRTERRGSSRAAALSRRMWRSWIWWISSPLSKQKRCGIATFHDKCQGSRQCCGSGSVGSPICFWASWVWIR